MDLLVDRSRPGRENMAIDVALLNRGEPTVRLYGWQPACVSLGYTQTEDEVNAPAIRERGFDLIERPTGGGAILHDESEVTYSVVLPTGFPGLPEDLFESYMFLADGILDALESLGVEAEYRKATGGKDAFCYLREAGVSIFVDGKKISGGAQRRTKDAVLQHGTLLVESDPALQAELFDQPEDTIRAGVTSLTDLGVEVDRDELVDRVAGAYLARYEVEDVDLLGPKAGDELAKRAAWPR